MRHILTGVLAIMFLNGTAAAKPFKEMFPGVTFEPADAQTFLESLDYKQGDVPISVADVTLNVTSEFYYLSPADAQRVLTEAWGNPPDVSERVLGMIFPSHMTPLDDTWGAAIYFDRDGYVSDENAADIDYGELLETMKQDTAASNAERERQGYERIELIGWAAEPHYDEATHKLHWAKEYQFGTDETHTLNYDVRVLGRRGVFSMNFITIMEELPVIEGTIPRVLAMPSFNEGARYADYVPGLDQVAAYGIGGLIAGKVLSKAGILAVILAFAKKGWILIVVALGALGAFVRRLLGGGSRPSA